MSWRERFLKVKQLFNANPKDFGVGIFALKQTPLKKTKNELLKNIDDYPVLNAVLRKIAENVAMTTFKFYVVRDNGKAIKYPLSYLRNKQKRRQIIKSADTQKEELLEHPIIDLLNYGNEFMTGTQVLEVTQIYIDLVGEAFWLLERDNLKVPVRIYPIPPTWVSKVPDNDYPFYLVNLGTTKEIPAEDIIWFKKLSIANPYGRGSGIGETLGDEIDTDEFASEHTKSWFYNKARPDILITAPGLSRQDTERLEQDWKNKLEGFFKWFKPYFLNADVKVHQLSQNFDGSDIIQLRKFERDLIIQTFGVPPEIIGVIENSNRATIEVADYIFAKRVIEPRLEFIISILQEKLVPMFDEKIIIDYEELTTRDWDLKFEALKIAPWCLSVNEWRKIVNEAPIDGGDVFMVPYNLVPTSSFTSPNSPSENGQNSKIVKVQKRLSEREVYELLEALDDWHIAYYVHPVYKKIIEEIGKETMEAIGPGLSFNLLDPRVQQFLDEQAGIYIKIVSEINKTTLEKLRKELIEGVRSGEGIPELAKRISKIFEEAKGYRAERIARTETLRAFNFAHYSAFKQGNIEYHEWVATRDDRVRDSHLQTDGQIVRVGDYFTLGSGAKALYPGDPALPPSESINCRCTVAAVVNKRSFLDTEEKRSKYWWEKEKRMETYDKLFERALKKAFQKQQDELLRKLRELGREE